VTSDHCQLTGVEFLTGRGIDYDYDYDYGHLAPTSPHFPFASFPRLRLSLGMRDNETVSCPFCGQDNCLMIDGSVGSQRFTTDCEVCCRPFEVVVECEDGELLSVSTNG